jgi:hypothetical protein
MGWNNCFSIGKVIWTGASRLWLSEPVCVCVCVCVCAHMHMGWGNIWFCIGKILLVVWRTNSYIPLPLCCVCLCVYVCAMGSRASHRLGKCSTTELGPESSDALYSWCCLRHGLAVLPWLVPNSWAQAILLRQIGKTVTHCLSLKDPIAAMGRHFSPSWVCIL